jgi:hypothetical protein
MIEDFLFWHQQGTWPRDPSGHIFLARAFNQVGRSIFGKLWMGTEGSAAFKAQDKPNAELLRRKLAFMNSEERERTIHAALNSHRELPKSIARGVAVHKAIARWAEAGELPTQWRSTGGGPLFPIPSYAWNTENLTERFRRCMMSLNRPFSNGFAGHDFGWIFVEAARLEQLLSQQPAQGEGRPAIPNATSTSSSHQRDADVDQTSHVVLVPSPPQAAPAGEGTTAPPTLAAASTAQTAPPAGAQSKAPRRLRRDIDKGDGAIVMALMRTAKLQAEKLKPRPTSALGLARALLKAEPRLQESLGRVDSVRQIFNDSNRRVNRLIDEGRVAPWWQRFLGRVD